MADPAPRTYSLDTSDADLCYRALQARDVRFDGLFFVAVISTGIYCRPVCRARLPLRSHCLFMALAAQAEAAGFRPCLRCRPELAPAVLSWSSTDASGTLARQAARLLDACIGEATGRELGVSFGGQEAVPAGAALVGATAQRLGVSDRHLRRLFEVHWGISPLQYLQCRRLLAAKQLLTDTRLTLPEVALASGFGSLRRFHAAWQQHYGLSPGALRRSAALQQAGEVRVRLSWRPPYDVVAMLDFLGRRALAGVEQPCLDGWGLRRTLRLGQGEGAHTGWVQVYFEPADHRVQVTLSESLAPVLPALVSRLRSWLDLDADPQSIHAVLGASFPSSQGLRVPGTLDGFELAVRAVLGQQITVVAACTLAARLVQALGDPIETPFQGLDRLFPTPAALAAAEPERLGRLGIVRQRQGALQALARAVMQGQLQLHPGADVVRNCTALQALPGIGDWTAQYIAMRALRWPDAFPAADVALQKALGVRTAKAALAAAEAWRPWRSYAVLRAWQGV